MTGYTFRDSECRVDSHWVSMPLQIGALDVAETLDGGQAFRWYRSDDESYYGVIGNFIVRVYCRDGDVWISRLGRNAREGLAQLAKRYITSGVDPLLMLNRFGSEPWVTDDVRCRLPLRVLRQDPWECLAAFICSQNSNMPRIKKMVASVAGLGVNLDGAGLHYLFPEPAVIVEIGEQRLRDLGLGYRAPSLVQVARTVSESSSWLEDLRNADYEEAKRELTGLPGVGPKVADCTLAYSLDKREAFPIDVHVMRAVTRIYGIPSNKKIDDVASWARDKFGEYSSLAQLYIFRTEVNQAT